VLASLVERRSGIATAPQKGKPLCVGFCFSLRDVLVIHDSESLSKPTTSCGSILSMGAANCRTAQPVGTDIQDGGYELPRIPLFPRRS
jgi:hypothetical protein